MPHSATNVFNFAHHAREKFGKEFITGLKDFVEGNYFADTVLESYHWLTTRLEGGAFALGKFAAIRKHENDPHRLEFISILTRTPDADSVTPWGVLELIDNVAPLDIVPSVERNVPLVYEVIESIENHHKTVSDRITHFPQASAAFMFIAKLGTVHPFHEFTFNGDGWVLTMFHPVQKNKIVSFTMNFAPVEVFQKEVYAMAKVEPENLDDS